MTDEKTPTRPDDDALVAESHRLNDALFFGAPASVEEVAALRQVAAAAIEWRAQFYKPSTGRRANALFVAVDALTVR